MDIDSLLDSARLPEMTLPLCLRLDLVAEYETLKRNRPKASNSLADGGSDVDVRLAELREQMRESTITVRMRALSRRRRRELLDANPPKGEAQHLIELNYDPDAFFAAAIPESIIEPKLTPAQWSKLAGSLTEDQYGELCDMVNALNHRKVDVPN